MKRSQRFYAFATPAFLWVFLLLLHPDAGAQKKGQELVDSLVAVLPGLPNDSTRVAALNKLGRAYRLLFKKEAEDYLTQALALAKQLGDARGAGTALKEMGLFYSRRNNFEKAADYVQQGIAFFRTAGDVVNEAAAFNSLGIVCQDNGKFDKAIDAYEQSKALYEKLGRPRDAAKQKAQIAFSYTTKERFDEAFKLSLEALSELDSTLDRAALPVVFNTIASIYTMRREDALAIDYYLKALRINEQEGSRVSAASNCANMSWCYQRQHMPLKAIEFAERALEIYRQAGDEKRQANSHHSLAVFYADLKDDKSCLMHLQQGLLLAKKLDEKNLISALQSSTAFYHLRKKNYSQALRHFEESAKARETVDNASRKIIEYTGLAQLYQEAPDTALKMNRRERLLRSVSYAQQAVELATQIKRVQSREPALLQLARSLAEQGNYEKAYNTYVQFGELRDSLLNDETTKAIARKEAQYEFSKKEDSLKYIQRLTAEKLKQQTLLTEQEKLRAEQQTLLASEKTLLAKQQTLLADKRQQELLLKQANLDLLIKEKLLQDLAFQKTEAELAAEQSQRQEKEKQLVIAGQEKTIQQTQLNLRNAEVLAKDNELASQQQKRNLYLAGFGLLLLSLFFVFRNYRNKQIARQRLAAEKLKTQKAEAVRKMAEFEMHGLRAQLNPHFMFNSLNAIQEQILKDNNDTASDYLTTFSRMLRQLLENAEYSFVPLGKELEFLRHYLNMERLRMPELRFEITVDPGIDPQETMIPNMILQPYLENAIWHGLSPKAGEKNIWVNVRQEGDEIVTEITDNGVGREKAAELKSRYRKTHKSKGMELLHKRFELIRTEFGSRIKIDVEDLKERNDAKGTRVRLVIPTSFAASMSMMHETVSNN